MDHALDQRALRGRGDLHAELPAMRCVGYRQAWQALDGTIAPEALREQGVTWQETYRKLARVMMSGTFSNTIIPGTLRPVVAPFHASKSSQTP